MRIRNLLALALLIALGAAPATVDTARMPYPKKVSNPFGEPLRMDCQEFGECSGYQDGVEYCFPPGSEVGEGCAVCECIDSSYCYWEGRC